jgi:5-methylcytosine-specific restriction endonuclease McrA
VRFAFTGSDAFLTKVERVRQILRHRCPPGSLEEIFAALVDDFLKRHDPALKVRPAVTRDSPPHSRRIPQWVKDAVFRRDAGQCVYESVEGVRCNERGGLEYDHINPWAKGGVSNDPLNIRLLCRAHNAFEAQRLFRSRRNGRLLGKNRKG